MSLHSFFLGGSKASVVWERERDRQTEKGDYRLPYWSIILLNHTVLSSELYIIFPRREALNWSLPGCCLAPCSHSGTPKLKTAGWLLQNWLYLMWTSAYIISQHPHISAQPRDCFCLFSGCLYMCVLQSHYLHCWHI